MLEAACGALLSRDTRRSLIYLRVINFSVLRFYRTFLLDAWDFEILFDLRSVLYLRIVWMIVHVD